MEAYEIWLQPEKFKVVRFYPYISIVTCPLLEQSMNRKTPQHDFIEEFGNKIKEMALAKGVRWDNKVVVEIKPTSYTVGEYINSNLFVGFKDGIIRIGLGVWMVDKHFASYHVQEF